MKFQNPTIPNTFALYVLMLLWLIDTPIAKTQEIVTKQQISSKERFFVLPIQGDYSKLNFCIQSNKKEYYLGEPIYIRTFIRNDSDSNISMCAGTAPVNYLNANRIEVIDAKQRPIERTIAKRLRPHEEELGIYSYGDFSASAFYWLTPGEAKKMEIAPLNVYYDFSRSGKYRITYYRRAVTWTQNIAPPLQSNTIEINILPSTSRLSDFGPPDFSDTPRTKEMAAERKDKEKEDQQ